MRQALLIIDMQRGSFTQASPRHDADGLVSRLNALSESVRGNGGLVVFVQHDGPPGDAHFPDNPGWQLLPELLVKSGDARVRKTACDSFLGTDLESRLMAHAIDELIVTGCATDFCVDTTVRSALGKGYRTIVPRDGHTTADRPHLSAQAIIAHHNAIWSEFISPAGAARITSCAQLLADRS